MAEAVSAGDRFSLTVFMALIVHALIILGVSFDVDRSKPYSSKKLEIALVNLPNEDRPDKADYLAQDNQMGSGTAEEKGLNKVKSSANPTVEPSNSDQAKQQKTAKASVQKAHVQAVSEKAIEVANELVVDKEKVLTAVDLLQQTEEIARLEAEIIESMNSYSRRPRKGFVNSISTHKYKAASYEAAWQRKIERVGNLNYPGEVRRKKLSGTLTMTVELHADGRLGKVVINRGSGHKVIDDAAIAIVRLAAPFAPFPVELMSEIDILVITRTWQFLNGGSLRTK